MNIPEENFIYCKYEKLERADCVRWNSRRLLYLVVENTQMLFLEEHWHQQQWTFLSEQSPALH